jgi:hypothetical protein
MNKIESKNQMNFKSLNSRNSGRSIRSKAYRIETRMVHSVSIEIPTNTTFHLQFLRKSPLIVRTSYFMQIPFSSISKVHSILLREPISSVNH